MTIGESADNPRHASVAAPDSGEEIVVPFGALVAAPGARLPDGGGRLSPVLPPPLALVEMALLVALVFAEYFWEGFPGLTRFNPHPYWIAILLLSLQYGTVSGLIAASLAIIGTVLIGMPEPDIEERYFNYLIRVWTQPVLWLLVAMLLGTFRARQIEQRDELLLQVENLHVRGATLLDHANNLRARCMMLERRVAMRDSADVGQLLMALHRLSEAEPGRWASYLTIALDAGFPRSNISLYSVEGGNVRLVLSHQRTAHGPRTEIVPDHPLISAVVGNARALCVVNPDDDRLLQGAGVAAVPIFGAPDDRSTSGVIGILRAEMLPATQIDASTTRRLSVIAEHLAPALQRGLLSQVADTGRLVASTSGNGRIDVETGPTLRRWRILKWLPGGRSGAVVSPDDADA